MTQEMKQALEEEKDTKSFANSLGLAPSKMVEKFDSEIQSEVNEVTKNVTRKPFDSLDLQNMNLTPQLKKSSSIPKEAVVFSTANERHLDGKLDNTSQLACKNGGDFIGAFAIPIDEYSKQSSKDFTSSLASLLSEDPPQSTSIPRSKSSSSSSPMVKRNLAFSSPVNRTKARISSGKTPKLRFSPSLFKKRKIEDK